MKIEKDPPKEKQIVKQPKLKSYATIVIVNDICGENVLPFRDLRNNHDKNRQREKLQKLQNQKQDLMLEEWRGIKVERKYGYNGAGKNSENSSRRSEQNIRRNKFASFKTR